MIDAHFGTLRDQLDFGNADETEIGRIGLQCKELELRQIQVNGTGNRLRPHHHHAEVDVIEENTDRASALQLLFREAPIRSGSIERLSVAHKNVDVGKTEVDGLDRQVPNDRAIRVARGRCSLFSCGRSKAGQCGIRLD